MIGRLAALASLIVAAGAGLLMETRADAQSIGVSPGELQVADALRGGEYDRILTIINGRSEPLAFRLGLEGEAASWITFYDEQDLSQPLDRIDVPPGTDTRVLVQVAVPGEAPNRRHVGTILVQSVAPGEEDGDDEGAEAGVTGGFAVDVLVDVTGTQRLEGILTGFTVRDTEVGLPFRARSIFKNTGNVVAEPEIQLVILDEGGLLAGGATVKQLPVKVDREASLKAEVETTGLRVGPYRIGAIVRLGEKEIFSQPFDVRLWPEGHFTRQGELERLDLTNAPNPGAAARLLAVFRNTGEVDTVATFLGEVYRDDVLIGTASSAELLVETELTIELDIIVPVDERGEYRVEGRVNFEGKETNSHSVTFKVPPDLGGGFLGRPWWQVIAGGFVAAAVVFAAAVEGRQRWQRRGQE